MKRTIDDLPMVRVSTWWRSATLGGTPFVPMIGSTFNYRAATCGKAWPEVENMNFHKTLVTAAFTLAFTCAQAQSPTSLLDDMRAHPEKYGCTRTNEGISCPS